MKNKKIIISIITLAVIASTLTMCAVMDSKDMVHMIDSGQSITLELAKPSYDIKVKGKQQEKMDWIQLDQQKSYNGFRQGFDEIFNINIVTENKVNGKSGCLYVDKDGDRNGNTTIEDAFRNKVFCEKYWKDNTVKTKIAKIASEAYTDVGESDAYAIAGALNAYFGLLADASNPSAFNPTQSLSREQFYTLVFKSEEGVREIKVDKGFEDSIGGKTEYSKYAQEVDEFGFLSVTNKSLDGNSYKGSISRAEAVYMIVNKYFKDELSKVTGKEKAFKDTKNAGDLALKAGFKTKNDKKEIIGKDRWQSYTLAYMLQHPDKGMHEELYKSMVVAKQQGLISTDESRWDEPISKAEAIMLVANTHLTKNSLQGYLSNVEYGKINLNKFKTSTGQPEVLGVAKDGLKYGDGWSAVKESEVPVDPNKKLSSGMTLWEAKVSIEYELKRTDKNSPEEMEMLADYAKSMGTTLEEVKRLINHPGSIQQPTESKPAPSSKPSQKPSVKPSQPAQQPQTSQNTGGKGKVTEWDKDGNGINDDLEPYSVTGEGSTESNPNFNLKAWGDN